MAFYRNHVKALKARLEEQRRFIQVLAGPRQVGKTTMIRQTLDLLDQPSHYAAADDISADNGTWITQQWEVARLKRRQSNAPTMLLVLDEIQKISNWSETVKKRWDEDSASGESIKLVLLGSSRLLIQRGLTESLAGRFELTYIGHWTFSEMNEAFGWSAEQFVWFGGYPGAADLIFDEKRWRDYVRDALIETSISRDVLMMTRVDKPALLRQVFDVGCAYSGQILSYNKILGQLQKAGNTTTLANYLNLLSEAGLLSGLEKYSGNIVTQRGSSPKFQVHNTALMSVQSAERFDTIRLRPDLLGRQMESAVGAHLLNAALSNGFKLFYWRDGNNEVDFVLQHGQKVVALEVKTTAKGNHHGGISAFQKQYNASKLLLVGNEGLNCEEFLKLDPIVLF